MSENRTDKIKRRKMLDKKMGRCNLCPIRGHENQLAKHRKKNHGQQPKYKDKR